MTRQPRTLYYVTHTTSKLPNPRDNTTTTTCENSYTYDYDEASDSAFNLAYRHARTLDRNAELSCVNTTPTTYCVFEPASHTRHIFTVKSEDDGIDLI